MANSQPYLDMLEHQTQQGLVGKSLSKVFGSVYQGFAASIQRAVLTLSFPLTYFSVLLRRAIVPWGVFLFVSLDLCIHVTSRTLPF